MKTRHLVLIFFALVTSMSSASSYAENISDRQLIEAFRQNPYRAAAGHTPYEAPADAVYTKAPKGYNAFYISHFGRHGSRFQSSEDVFEDVCEVLDHIKKKGLLTAKGDSLWRDLHGMWNAHKNQMGGMLTRRGALEHQGIASRMFARNPEIFRQTDRSKVSCRSTVVTRCVESMGNFAMALIRLNPSLDVETQTDLLTGRTDTAPDSKKIRVHSSAAEKNMLKEADGMPTLAARLFTDPAKAAGLIEDEDLGRFLFNVFKAAAAAGCLDQDYDPLRFFTPEELLMCNKIRNIHFSSSYGCFGPTRDIAVSHSYPYMQLLLEEADAAIAGNGHCADLRFAHDKQVGPLLSLLDLENYNVYTPTDGSHNHQAAWKYLSMGVNLQMIFYRNRQDDILVKFLCNERETLLPSLKAVEGYYYRWEDVRRHILNRIANR